MQIVFPKIFSFLGSWVNLAHLRKWSNMSIIPLALYKKRKEKKVKPKNMQKINQPAWVNTF